MKYIILMICFVLASCDLFAQDVGYTLSFLYNSDIPDGSYGLYTVELSDTNLTPFINGGNSDLIQSYYHGNYIQSDLQIVDPALSATADEEKGYNKYSGNYNKYSK